MGKITDEKIKKIKIIISDVDGVLTDGCIYIGNRGEMFKAFNSQDGQGVKLARSAGLDFAIITGRSSEIVDIRADELGITEVHQGIENKVDILEEIRKDNNIKKEEIAYIGDDVSDLGVMKEVGLAFTVNNGVGEVKEIADYITERNGGQGAVREVIDFILNNI